MDTAHWPQIVVKPIEEIVIVATNNITSSPNPTKADGGGEKQKPRPEKEEAINCPRCHSINTKFCYYNNYSLTQPRYFCKTCRRYWTQGGSLRNIPVGGGSRKNKRSSMSCSSPNNSTTKIAPPNPISTKIAPPKNINIHEGQDLNLAFPNISELFQQNNNNNNNTSASASSTSTTTNSTTITTTTASTSHLSVLELLTGITSNSMGLHSFMPVQVQADTTNSSNVYSTCGFPLQDFKPTLNFSLEHDHGNIIGGSGFASLHGGVDQETSTIGRVLFPFEDLKQVSSNNPTMDHNNKEQQGYSAGYWTGMLGDGGGSW